MKELFISTYQGENLLIKENILGELRDNILKYSSDTDDFLIDLTKKEFIKENIDSILKITNDKCELTLKELNKSIDIPLNNFEFLIKENIITIIYKLESQEEELKIEINIGEC